MLKEFSSVFYQVGIGFDFQLLRTIATIARSKISLVALPYRGTSSTRVVLCSQMRTLCINSEVG
jgi:hypothetical protein